MCGPVKLFYAFYVLFGYTNKLDLTYQTFTFCRRIVIVRRLCLLSTVTENLKKQVNRNLTHVIPYMYLYNCIIP